MATISSQKTSKPDPSTAKEEATPKKRPPASGLKEKKVAGAKTRNSSTSVKTNQSQSIREGRKNRETRETARKKGGEDCEAKEN